MALAAAETAFKHLAQNGFQHVFDEWQMCWAKCVAFNGYFLNGVVVNTEEFQKYRFFFFQNCSVFI